MPAIHSWSPNELPDVLIRHLMNEECVVLPTESTYEVVASAHAAQKLARFVTSDTVAAVVLTELAEVLDWLPLLCGASVRLLARLGPGAITLQASAGYLQGLFPRLPEAAQRLVSGDAGLNVRWPYPPTIWCELRRAGVPLVSIPLASGIDAEAAARLAGDDVACVVDNGPTQYQSLPSIVQADGRRCRLVHEGALRRDLFEEYTRCHIVFVCTGNTCRSPLAEVLCAKLLARHLGCGSHELDQHGFLVHSAGLAAMMGAEASPGALEVAREFQADLSLHRSKSAMLDTFLSAAHIFTMTASHWYALENHSVRARLLSPVNEDIIDPIGGELDDYRACARQILECLQERLPELLES